MRVFRGLWIGFALFAAVATPALAAVIEDFDFSDGSQGWVYNDDTFRGANEPAYATGFHDIEGSGRLFVQLGNVDGSDILGMSGGWVYNLNLAAPSTVTFTFDYRMIFRGGYEPDECSEVLLSIDGNLVSTTTEEFLAEFCGDGSSTFDTSWTTAVVSIPLGAGSHEVILGGFNSGKTVRIERTELYFDTFTFEIPDGPTEDDCSDGVDDDSDGLTDCSDPDCTGVPPCEAGQEQTCNDDFDNDDDGLTDCSDPDCQGDPACQVAESQPGCRPIRAADIPVTIDVPGAYCLVESVEIDPSSITSLPLIDVTTDSVSLDLGGNELRYWSENQPVGVPLIRASGSLHLSDGFIETYGDAVAVGAHSTIENVHIEAAEDEDFVGVTLGAGSEFTRGSVVVVATAIAMERLSSVTHSRVLSFGIAARGIVGADSCIISDNIVTGGDKGGGSIILPIGAENCKVDGNIISASGGSNCGGIDVFGHASSVTNNVASGSGYASICVYGANNTIRDNVVDHVGVEGSYNQLVDNTITGFDMRLEGDKNIVTGNTVTSGPLNVGGNNNVVSKNLAESFSIAPTNSAGPVQSAMTATSPWANILIP